MRFCAWMDRTTETVMRHPALAVRRRHHRALMKSGYLSAVLSAGTAFVWVAIVRNGRNDNQNDAQMFAWLTLAFASLAAVLLTSWWRLAGNQAAGSQVFLRPRMTPPDQRQLEPWGRP